MINLWINKIENKHKFDDKIKQKGNNWKKN